MPRASNNCENNSTNGVVLGASGTYLGTPAWFGLNSGDPLTTGANEISGGSYARVSISWGTIGGVTAGQVANSSSLTVNVPASTTVAYFSTWGASSGTGSGGYAIGGALSSSVTFNTAGQLVVPASNLTLAST